MLKDKIRQSIIGTGLRRSLEASILQQMLKRGEMAPIASFYVHIRTSGYFRESPWKVSPTLTIC